MDLSKLLHLFAGLVGEPVPYHPFDVTLIVFQFFIPVALGTESKFKVDVIEVELVIWSIEVGYL